jgi:hypothetical protein
MHDGGRQGFSQIQILILIQGMSRKKSIPVMMINIQIVLKRRIIPLVLGVMNLKKKNQIIHLEYLQ